ncbi:MAG: hypothetical protein M3N82_11735 [Pseudomonadota bacterium]|nr:hypothetical protein [Pseudomonadota bacterium]
MSRQAAQGRSGNEASASSAKAEGVPREPGDAEKTRRRLDGETLGTTVDTWA